MISVRKHFGMQQGDTIVEVLIAIAIAAFAIGLSYATAQRSLQQSITAREHNEALNVMENQIADLKIRFQKSVTEQDFVNNFASLSNFCLNDSGSDPNLSSTWNALKNDGANGPPSQNAPLALKTNNGPYDPGCRQGTDVYYYVNITTSPSSATSDSTLYHIMVRWEKIGGGPVNQSNLDYKLNGSTARTLSAVTQTSGSILPSCTGAGNSWTISEDDKASPQRLALMNQNGRRAYYGAWAAPWPIDPNCKYTIQLSTHNNTDPNTDPYQQVFAELCSGATVTTNCSLTGASPSALYRSSVLTPDITSLNLNPSMTDPTITLTTTPTFVIFKHCTLWAASVPCKTSAALNAVDAYDLIITPS